MAYCKVTLSPIIIRKMYHLHARIRGGALRLSGCRIVACRHKTSRLFLLLSCLILTCSGRLALAEESIAPKESQAPVAGAEIVEDQAPSSDGDGVDSDLRDDTAFQVAAGDETAPSSETGGDEKPKADDTEKPK